MLIGRAHYLHVHGIAASTVDAFETPLGRVPIDVEALRKIADLPFVIRADAPHAPEQLSAMPLQRTSPMCCASCGVGLKR